MFINQTFADNRTVNTVNAALIDVSNTFDIDLSAASEVITTKNETVISALVQQGQEFLQNALTSNNWVADWFGYSDADQNKGTDRKGRRDDEDW